MTYPIATIIASIALNLSLNLSENVRVYLTEHNQTPMFKTLFNPLSEKVNKPEKLLSSANQDFEQGFDYQYGLSTIIDRQKANEHFEQAALKGNLEAKFFLSLNFLQQGQRDKALQYAQEAVTEGSEIAKYALANWWLAKNEAKYRTLKQEALKAMTEELNKGDLHYVIFLANEYYYGLNGMPVDLDKAIHYYELAAQQGNAVALEELGKIYLEELHDLDKAETYLLQAAEKNNAEAQYLLGDAVYTEKEDEKNILYWVEKAAENQHISAILKLANYYVGKKEYDQALYYVKKGVALNHDDSLIAVAELYEYGLGMLQDDEKALTYYKKSNEILKDKWLMDKIKMLEAKIKDKK